MTLPPELAPILPLIVISPSSVPPLVELMVKEPKAVAVVAPMFPVIVTFPSPESITKFSALLVVLIPLSVESKAMALSVPPASVVIVTVLLSAIITALLKSIPPPASEVLISPFKVIPPLAVMFIAVI